MPRRHGEMDYFIQGEGLVSTFDPLKEFDASFLSAGVTVSNPPLSETRRKFKFGKMFALEPFQPQNPKGLVDLGNAMLEAPSLDDHSSLPAGFTYLAQFVAHDISFDRTKGVPEGKLSPAEIEQGRSPSLDLDSLYGDLPLPEGMNLKLFSDDLIHLALGETHADFTIASSPKDCDLKRTGNDPASPSKAVLGDDRNDDNLALAQTTVAFIKFHNAVVDRLANEGLSGRPLFDETRKKVVQHYQSIVLHDFLPRVVEEAVLNDVLKNGPRFFKLPKGEQPFVPVEFAFAAYRFGHCLVRDTYEWNRFHEEGAHEGSARLFDLFRFTGASGLMAGGNVKKLPMDWIIDWSRFHDFSGFGKLSNSPKSNRARKIAPSLTVAFKSLPGFLEGIDEEFRSLAVLDLIRGWKVGLASGQAVATAMELPSKLRLSLGDIAQGPHETILVSNGFHEQTPLWYYILKEAERFHDGVRLGPVGSRIVAETFVVLIAASRESILRTPAWRPDRVLRPDSNIAEIRPDRYSMAELLALSKDDINPVG